MLRWLGSHWQLRDLGSRNGTFVNGERLRAHTTRALKCGDELCFGSIREVWRLEDDAAPRPMLVTTDGDETLEASGDLITINVEGEPAAALVYDNKSGVWLLEELNGSRSPVEHGQVFSAGNRVWRFSSLPSATVPLEASCEPPLALRFRVSSDEEHVDITAFESGREIVLGGRGHNYLLLTLARSRIHDREAGIKPASSGWRYADDLVSDLRTSNTQLNLDVFRVRRHCARLGLHSPTTIIERRVSSKQLRIGVENLTIESLR